MIFIFTNLHSREIALKIGQTLLEKRLIACYNFFPIESAYWWKGEIVRENETMLILKTTEPSYSEIESYIKENSDYEVSEVTAVKADKVNKEYLAWLEKEVGGTK